MRQLLRVCSHTSLQELALSDGPTLVIWKSLETTFCGKWAEDNT
jgi:hypothetical protein